MMSLTRPLILCVAAVSLLALPSKMVRANDLTFAVIGAEKGSWSSNPLMVTKNAKPLTGSTTSPEFIIKDTTDTATLGLDARADENLFNQTSYNSTDGHATVSASEQGQLWSVQLQQQTDYDTTRTSEPSNYGFTPIVTRHTGLSASPQITYAPNASDQISLAGSVTSSQYDNKTFTNYETFSATPTYSHNFNERNAAQFMLQAQRYQATKGSSVSVDSAGPSIGWKTSLSPRFTASATVGAQTSRQYNAGVATSPWAWQYVFSTDVAFKGEQDTINLNSARTQTPYGNGTDALQTSFGLTESHNLNSHISLNFGANYLTATYQVSSTGNLGSLTTGTVGATYHATETLDVTTTYQYRTETLTNESKTPQDHSGTINLVYRPKAWTL